MHDWLSRVGVAVGNRLSMFFLSCERGDFPSGGRNTQQKRYCFYRVGCCLLPVVRGKVLWGWRLETAFPCFLSCGRGDFFRTADGRHNKKRCCFLSSFYVFLLSVVSCKAVGWRLETVFPCLSREGLRGAARCNFEC